MKKLFKLWMPIYALASLLLLSPLSAPQAGEWIAGSPLFVVAFCTDVNDVMKTVKFYEEGKIEEGNMHFELADGCYRSPMIPAEVVDVLYKGMGKLPDQEVPLAVLSVKLAMEDAPIVYLIAPGDGGPDQDS